MRLLSNKDDKKQKLADALKANLKKRKEFKKSRVKSKSK
jgi:hypothetical protein